MGVFKLPDDSNWIIQLLYDPYILLSKTAIIEVVCSDHKIRGVVQNKKSSAIG